MSSVFLWAAYGATWLIHSVYLGSIMLRYLHLRRQAKDVLSLDKDVLSLELTAPNVAPDQHQGDPDVERIRIR